MKSVYTAWIFFILALLVDNSTARSNQGANEEKEYDVKKIPAELLKDAGAVVREYILHFEVKNKRHAKEKVKRVVTIFKEEERHYGKLELWYDKFHEIEDLEGKIFDANGREIRDLEKQDIKDYCSFSNYSLYADSRVRVAELYYDQYPFTVEFTYEYSYDGYLNWPVWLSQISLDPIEQNRFEVFIPQEDSLRYWCNRDTVRPLISIEGSKRLYVWGSTNLPKLSKDVVGEDIEDIATMVRIAPSSFEYGDYEGDMRTWKNFGTWDYSLAQGRDVLPESAIRDIHSLLKPADDIREKVKKLYRYMQNRTRYVSIQLGIGGWQPFDAAYVHERGYGDCKALSNYMVALLKEAGITAYTIDIQPGDHRFPFIQEFPSAQFTHEIACVPVQLDTIWLECTSQSIPFGHIGKANENRGALLITPEGGIVVRTPRSTPQQNSQIRCAHVTMKDFGTADVSAIITRCGNQQDYIRGALDDATPEECKQWIMDHLGTPGAYLRSYHFDGLDSHELEIHLTMQIALPRFSSISGNRLFFQPNLMERETYIPHDVARRLSPVRFGYPYHDVDSICYSLPGSYTVESIPAEVHLESSFGGFKSKTMMLGDTAVRYTRSLEIREYTIPANNYSEYRKFFADIVKADRAQVVLVRKQ